MGEDEEDIARQLSKSVNYIKSCHNICCLDTAPTSNDYVTYSNTFNFNSLP